MTQRELLTLADRVQRFSALLVADLQREDETAAWIHAKFAGHYANQLIALAELGHPQRYAWKGER